MSRRGRCAGCGLVAFHNFVGFYTPYHGERGVLYMLCVCCTQRFVDDDRSLIDTLDRVVARTLNRGAA